MTEKTHPFPIVSRENIIPFIGKFREFKIFDEITELAANNGEVLKEIRNKIAEHLDRIIIANLKIAFDGQEEDELLSFLVDLTQLTSGEEQVALIEKKFMGASSFWQMVEADLYEDLLKPLKELLRKNL